MKAVKEKRGNHTINTKPFFSRTGNQHQPFFSPGKHSGPDLLTAHTFNSDVHQTDKVQTKQFSEKPNGVKVFNCPDYAGDAKLEACLNDTDRLKSGDKGASVEKVQRGLNSNLQENGIVLKDDGAFGQKTGQAVMFFKKKHILGFENYPDVGPGTMEKLDQLCSTGGQKQPPDELPPCPQYVFGQPDEFAYSSTSQQFSDPLKASCQIKKPPVCLSTPKYYERSDFNDRFNGYVDPVNHKVILMMGVTFSHGMGWNQHSPEKRDQAIEKFKHDFKSVVEQTWSYKYAFQSNCQGALDKYEVKVNVIIDAPNAHANLFISAVDVRSSAGDGIASLNIDDNKPKENRWKFKGEEKIFVQVPSTHEFGHLIGLKHVHCNNNDSNCYGVTPLESMDIMGRGSYVSPKDYEPFRKIMKRFGQDCLPPSCNDWHTVSPG